MNLANLLVFILLSCGISHLWSYSEIFQKMRNLVAKIPYIRKPLICPECSSFWMGVFCCFFFNPFIYLNLFNIIFCGIITYISCVLLFKILNKLEVNQF